jgi:hypothetical protein
VVGGEPTVRPLTTTAFGLARTHRRRQVRECGRPSRPRPSPVASGARFAEWTANSFVSADPSRSWTGELGLRPGVLIARDIDVDDPLSVGLGMTVWYEPLPWSARP